MKRDIHSMLRWATSIPIAAYTSNDALTTGTAVNIADVGPIEAAVVFDNTGDALAGALAWECWVEKMLDDGAGAADTATALALVTTEYLGPASGMATPSSGSGICLVNAAGEDDRIYRVGIKQLLDGYEWIRIQMQGIGNHAGGNVIHGEFVFGPQNRPVANP